MGFMSNIAGIDTDTLQVIASWLISTVLFAALIIYLSKHPQKRTKPLKAAFTFMFLGGMALYCYCHFRELQETIKAINANENVSQQMLWVKYSNLFYYVPYVIMRALMDVGMMFSGRCNTDVFYKLPEAKIPFAVLSFWLINLLTFYTTASALLIRFGNDLLRWIRIMTSKVSDVDLVFGINSDSLAFGRNIANRKGSMLIYVDSVAREDYEASIRDLGGLVYSDNEALNATTLFLKRILIWTFFFIRRIPIKKLRLYALSSEYDLNLQYALMMSESLENAKILPEQTELVLLGTDEWKGMKFQSDETQYGYGNVVSFDEYEMTARLLIHEYPLCNVINFDNNGCATEDMNVLIVGFGRIGHEVLRKVIANGQFEGSRFHATIYDPNFKHRVGFIKSQYPMMFASYNITFEPQGGRGLKIFDFLKNNASKIKYIVVCIEDEDIARDIAIHMVDRLQNMGYSIHVYTCNTKSVRCYSRNAKECKTHWIYDSKLLYSGELDRYAMEINHRYCKGKSLADDWKRCEYFDRMSSRASIDYLMPLISRIKTVTNVKKLTTEQEENLARSEHLRWCAFYYTFGFRVMEKEELVKRVRKYQKEMSENGESTLRVTKDKKAMKHACLVDWDKLDEISKIENSWALTSENYNDTCRVNDEKESLRRWVKMVIKLMEDEIRRN